MSLTSAQSKKLDVADKIELIVRTCSVNLVACMICCLKLEASYFGCIVLRVFTCLGGASVWFTAGKLVSEAGSDSE